jgi:hypothetical protein
MGNKRGQASGNRADTKGTGGQKEALMLVKPAVIIEFLKIDNPTSSLRRNVNQVIDSNHH